MDRLNFSIAQTLFITLVTISGPGLLSAEKYLENCHNEKEYSKWKFCFESTGFYYTLENEGTWNLSLTEGEGLHERELFLASLQANNCPVTLSTDPRNCANNCCYCELDFPLPHHPITNGLLLPSGLTCKAYLLKREQFHQYHLDHSWQSNTNLDYQCRLSTLGQDPVVCLPFLRLYLDNLRQLEDTYNNPRPIVTKDEHKEQLRRHKERFRLSWRNSSVNILKNNTAAAKVFGNKEVDQFGASTTDTFSSTTPIPELTTMLMEEVNEIKFSFYTDVDKEIDIVTVESIPDSNLTMTFSVKAVRRDEANIYASQHEDNWDYWDPRDTRQIKQANDCKNVSTKNNFSYLKINSVDLCSIQAPTECLSKHRKWAMYPPCWYSINSTGLSTCSDVRLAVNVSSILIHRYVSDVNVSVSMEIEGFWDEYLEDWNDDSLYLYETNNDMLQCTGIPRNLRITEIWANGEHISTLLSLEKIAPLLNIENEIVFTASVAQKVIGKKEYTSLSRFWSKFYFGDCLYRNCWRDLWNVLPDEFVESLQALYHHGRHKRSPQNSLDIAYFRWGYFLPLCLLCLVLIVYSCTVEFYDSEIGG